MRTTRHEWDWPKTDAGPRRVRPRAIVATRQGWASPAVTRLSDRFFSVVVRCLVAAFAAVVAVIGIGALWLICAAVSA